jgi:hypothetical protein
MFLTVLKYFLNEEIEDACGLVEFLHFYDSLFRESNEVMETVLIAFEPNCFCQLLNMTSVIYCADLLNM